MIVKAIQEFLHGGRLQGDWRPILHPSRFIKINHILLDEIGNLSGRSNFFLKDNIISGNPQVLHRLSGLVITCIWQFTDVHSFWSSSPQLVCLNSSLGVLCFCKYPLVILTNYKPMYWQHGHACNALTNIVSLICLQYKQSLLQPARPLIACVLSSCVSSIVCMLVAWECENGVDAEELECKSQ
jgi:hypothetical protein